MSNNTRKPIVLSVKDKNLVAAQNTRFSTASFDVTSLQSVLTSNNYSPIAWRDRRREENFSFATAAPLDFDTGMTIQQAEATLAKRNLNYALITSKSHDAAAHRFHVIIPLKRKICSAKDYKRVIRELKDEVFPSIDPNAMDAARFFYFSPQGSTYSSNWNGQDFDPDSNKGDQIADAWDDYLVVSTGKKDEIYANLIDDKTPIFCPFHSDANPSAFVKQKDGTREMFIHCSACGKTYWKVEAPLSERCERYWSHGTDVFEFGIADDAFYMSAIGKEKFQMFMNAIEKEERQNAYKYLLDNKHICHLKVVNHISDVMVDQSKYEVDREKGIVAVHYAPVPVKIQDNPFVESYLESTFGTHKDFIKQWLAVYCYTNYRELPTLILKGARGSGKNTFAEMVYSIFPTISQMWEAERRSFTPEAEKKLLVADETVCDDPEQYKLLKQYAGGKHATVNKKYLPPYEVTNNMNIIILSNSAIPIYVARDEKPTSEENNQFFVYDFKPFKGVIDPEMDQKLEDRIGHYVRTELKTVFDGISFTGNRYSIKTPITTEEAGLFESNETEEESATEMMIDKILEKSKKPGFEYAEHLKEGFLPRAMLEDSRTITKLGTHRIVKTLREQGYLEMTNAEKKQADKKRRGCYAMTDKLLKELGIVRKKAA